MISSNLGHFFELCSWFLGKPLILSIQIKSHEQKLTAFLNKKNRGFKDIYEDVFFLSKNRISLQKVQGIH